MTSRGRETVTAPDSFMRALIHFRPIAGFPARIAQSTLTFAVAHG